LAIQVGFLEDLKKRFPPLLEDLRKRPFLRTLGWTPNDLEDLKKMPNLTGSDLEVLRNIPDLASLFGIVSSVMLSSSPMLD
jgi:hypothetical protein